MRLLTCDGARPPLLAAAVGRQGGGGGSSSGGSGGRRQKQQHDEDVEIFNIDSGWNVEALEGMADLLDVGEDGAWTVDALGDDDGEDADGSDAGWSVSAAGGAGAAQAGRQDFAVEDEDEDFFEDDDEEQEFGGEDVDAASWQAGTSGRPEAAAAALAAQRAAPVFNGKVLRKAEQQLLASLPRHTMRKLEAEQREADEGGLGGCWAGLGVGSWCTCCWGGASTKPLLLVLLADQCTSTASCLIPQPGVLHAAAEKARLRPSVVKKAAARLKTHQQLRIISGTAAGRRLKSPQGDQVGGAYCRGCSDCCGCRQEAWCMHHPAGLHAPACTPHFFLRPLTPVPPHYIPTNPPKPLCRLAP